MFAPARDEHIADAYQSLRRLHRAALLSSGEEGAHIVGRVTRIGWSIGAPLASLLREVYTGPNVPTLPGGMLLVKGCVAWRIGVLGNRRIGRNRRRSVTSSIWREGHDT